MSHPFFVITTQKQIGRHMSSDGRGKSIGLLGAAGAIGLRGLCHGIVVSQVFQTPNNVVYLWATEQTREFSRQYLFRDFPALPLAAVDAIQVTYSAIVANFLSLSISYPANLVVTKMVVQDNASRLGFINTCRDVYKRHGAHGFTHGFFSKQSFIYKSIFIFISHGVDMSANFVYSSAFSVSWWFAYGNCRRVCTEVIPGIAEDEVYIDAFSGFCSGVFATAVSHPLDSVCARIMTGNSKSRSLTGTARDIITQEGHMVLWRGLFPSMMGTLVSSTIFALCYEYIKRAAMKEA